MALKGSFTKYYRWGSYNNLTSTSYSSDADISVTFDWNITEQSILYNYSKVSYSVKIKCISMAYVKEYLGDIANHDTIRIGGAGAYNTLAVYFNNVQKLTVPYSTVFNLKEGETATVGSGSSTLYHNNSDGTYEPTVTIEWSLSRAYEAAEPGNYISCNEFNAFSSSISFNSIARHAIMNPSFTIEGFKDDGEPTISYQVPSGMTAYIYLSLDGTGKTEDTHLETVSGEGTITYTFTAADQEKLWTIRDLGVTTKAVRFYIKSTFNGTVYREPSNWVNLTLDNYWPTLDPEVWDANTDAVDRLTGNKYKLIRYYSNAAFNTGGQARKRATIDIQTTVNAGKPLDGATGVFEKVTSNIFDFNIRDSYGTERSATMEFSKPAQWVDYVKLTCGTEVTEMTADGDVQVIIRGKCFTGDFGKKVNRLRVNYDIAKNNEDFEHVDLGYADYASNYGNSFYVDGNDYTYTLNITGLEYLSVYDLTVRVSDEIAVEGVPASTILASTPIFDWGRTDFNFNVPVTIKGASVPSIVTQVLNDNGWSYRKWSDGTAECWRTLSVTAAVSTSTNASWYSSGELSATNLSFPFTFAARPSVTVQTMPTGQSWCIVFPSNTTGSTTKTGSYQLNSMSSTTSRAHLLSYDVKGRWK